MKIAKNRSETDTSRAPESLQEAVLQMEASLTAWRHSLESPGQTASQSHFDEFLVAAHEGYRLMALKRGLAADDADDIAQTCILALARQTHSGGRPPFVPSVIDSLTGNTPSSKKPKSFGTPLAGYLHGMLSKGVGARARLMRRRASRSTSLDEISDSEESGGSGLIGTKPDKVLINVSARQNYDLAMRIHDHYLDTVTYRRKPLRSALGAWTPMREWIGELTPKDRPAGISKSMLELHIRNIREFIRLGKSMTTTPSSETERIH